MRRVDQGTADRADSLGTSSISRYAVWASQKPPVLRAHQQHHPRLEMGIDRLSILHTDSLPFRIADDLRAALAAKRPVVALESSLIAHGFPRPDNLALGREIEAAVRANGAEPATIAIVEGKVCVGLTDDELRLIAEDQGVHKCSARDLAYLTAHGLNGGTTVAATARICAAIGLPVFATGGIGGVHRGAEASHDVSADLVELGRSRVAVVCAGAKVLLDLPATLEVLETQSVPVIGFNCDQFPAFYTAASGLPLAHRVDSMARLAEVVRMHEQMAAPSAIIVCNPPPPEHAFDAEELEGLVSQALVEADSQAITGAKVTPFVLAALARLSGGRTRDCNRALILSNARVAADLAVALAAL